MTSSILRFDSPRADVVLKDLEFVGLEVTASVDRMLIENCHFRYIIFTTPARKRRVTIRNSIVMNYGPVFGLPKNGIYAAAVDGLTITGCVVGRDQRDPSDEEHGCGMYIQGGGPGNCTGVKVQDCYVFNAPAEGIKMRGGGIALRNLLRRNPIGIFMGGGDPANNENVPGGVDAILTQNVITEACDISPTNHRRWGICTANVRAGIATGNIVADAVLATASQHQATYPPEAVFSGAGNVLNGQMQVWMPGGPQALKPMSEYSGQNTAVAVRDYLLS